MREFVVVRKMKNLCWLDGEGNDGTGERKMKFVLKSAWC